MNKSEIFIEKINKNLNNIHYICSINDRDYFLYEKYIIIFTYSSVHVYIYPNNPTIKIWLCIHDFYINYQLPIKFEKNNINMGERSDDFYYTEIYNKIRIIRRKKLINKIFE